jgi:hypothetical protein
VLYLVATQLRKNRSDLTGKTNGWKTIVNTLTVHYSDRIAANTINCNFMKATTTYTNNLTVTAREPQGSVRWS